MRLSAAMSTQSCIYCTKQFTLRNNLTRHLKDVHNTCHLYEGTTFKNRCLEDICNISFRSSNELVRHLKTVHNKVIDTKEYKFHSITDFKIWKERIEKEEHVKYSTWRAVNGIRYYYCNRNSRGKTEYSPQFRQKRSQGSCKLEWNCISKIRVRNVRNYVRVQWVKTHYGHTKELQHIPLPMEDKREIVKQLKSGVTPNRILQSVRDNITETKKRIDLLTRQDIRNIMVAFKISGGDVQLTSKDPFSVDKWAEECLQKVDSPLIFYKKQNENFDGFKKEDFCFIFMNKFQQDMLSSHGSKLVAIDGTLGLVGYDFELVTIMVEDDCFKGFPVAFMFTNRKDPFVYKLLFHCVKKKVGVLSPNVFMSDTDYMFYNAFKRVNAPSNHVLFSPWYVDRAWQSNLTTICSKDKRNQVYKKLKLLLQRTPANVFPESLESFLVFLNNDDTREFRNYFVSYYSSSFKKWAYCYRQDCGINSNIYIESLHKVIKYFYLDRESVKKLDDSIDCVMNYLRDRSARKQILKFKGKATKESSINFKNHVLAIEQPLDVIEIDNDSFTVTDLDNNIYNVKNMNIERCCADFCSSCRICIHSFSCDCKEFLSKKICEHIHFVNFFISRNGPVEVVVEGESESADSSKFKHHFEEKNLCNDTEEDCMSASNNDDYGKLVLTALNNLNNNFPDDDSSKDKIKKHLKAIVQLCSEQTLRSPVAKDITQKNNENKREIYLPKQTKIQNNVVDKLSSLASTDSKKSVQLLPVGISTSTVKSQKCSSTGQIEAKTNKCNNFQNKEKVSSSVLNSPFVLNLQKTVDKKEESRSSNLQLKLGESDIKNDLSKKSSGDVLKNPVKLLLLLTKCTSAGGSSSNRKPEDVCPTSNFKTIVGNSSLLCPDGDKVINSVNSVNSTSGPDLQGTTAAQTNERTKVSSNIDKAAGSHKLGNLNNLQKYTATTLQSNASYVVPNILSTSFSKKTELEKQGCQIEQIEEEIVQENTEFSIQHCQLELIEEEIVLENTEFGKQGCQIKEIEEEIVQENTEFGMQQRQVELIEEEIVEGNTELEQQGCQIEQFEEEIVQENILEDFSDSSLQRETYDDKEPQILYFSIDKKDQKSDQAGGKLLERINSEIINNPDKLQQQARARKNKRVAKKEIAWPSSKKRKKEDVGLKPMAGSKNGGSSKVLEKISSDASNNSLKYVLLVTKGANETCTKNIDPANVLEKKEGIKELPSNNTKAETNVLIKVSPEMIRQDKECRDLDSSARKRGKNKNLSDAYLIPGSENFVPAEISSAKLQDQLTTSNITPNTSKNGPQICSIKRSGETIEQQNSFAHSKSNTPPNPVQLVLLVAKNNNKATSCSIPEIAPSSKKRKLKESSFCKMKVTNKIMDKKDSLNNLVVNSLQLTNQTSVTKYSIQEHSTDIVTNSRNSRTSADEPKLATQIAQSSSRRRGKNSPNILKSRQNQKTNSSCKSGESKMAGVVSNNNTSNTLNNPVKVLLLIAPPGTNASVNKTLALSSLTNPGTLEISSKICKVNRQKTHSIGNNNCDTLKINSIHDHNYALSKNKLAAIP